MHSIYQSELAHLYARKSRNLQHAVAKAITTNDTAQSLFQVYLALDTIPLITNREQMITLASTGHGYDWAHYTADSMWREHPTEIYWELQEMIYRKRKDSIPLTAIDSTDYQIVLRIAESGSRGAPLALAWKALLGEAVPAHFTLPTNTKRLKPNKERPRATLPTVLTAYPNPSNGPVYLVYNVPEGVEQAHLRMVDASGRLVLEQRIADRTGIIEVLPRNLSPGMHVAAIAFDGMPVAHAKVSIVR